MAGKKDYQDIVQTFEIIYGLYQEPIERYLVMRIHNQEFACELCQETFERFWKFLLRQETASQQTAYYKNWLYLTATNLAIDEHRHNKLINFLPMPESEAYAIFAELMVEGDEDRILERLWLQDEVPLLSPQYRESLLMRHYYGYTEKETASKLGITEKTVSANVSRGKSQLHRKYFPVTADLQRLEALHARDEINNLIRGAKGVILINKLDEHEAKALDWRYRAYMRKHRSELRDDLLCDDLSLQRDLA